MRALFHKDARQVLPAAAGIALFNGAALVALATNGWPFLPRSDTRDLFVPAMFAMLQGTLIGVGAFGLEGWGRTEAYLTHRALGSGWIFWSKVATGLLSLGLALVVPIACFGMWHLLLFPKIEGADATGVIRLALAATAGAPGFAIGVLAAQLRKPWFVRWILGAVGVFALLLSMRWTGLLLESEDLLDAARFAFIQVVVMAMILVVAYVMFRPGVDVHRPFPRNSALILTAAALALFWTPAATAVAEVQYGLRTMLLESYPQIIERKGGDLLRVAHDELSRYWTLDEQERRTSTKPMQDYRGPWNVGDDYSALFNPTSTIVGLTRPWGDRADRTRGGAAINLGDTIWIYLSPIRIAVLERGSADTMRLRWFKSRPDGTQFSNQVVFVGNFGAMRLQDAGPAFLLADMADRTLWAFEQQDGGYGFKLQSLPNGDTLERVERCYARSWLRVGLYLPQGMLDGLVLVGLQDRYLWTADGFVPESRGHTLKTAPALGIPESRAADVQAWRLEPSHIDGVAFHLDVVDVRTGGVALAHDFGPRTYKQRLIAAGSLALSLARPPVGELLSLSGAPFDDRDVVRRGSLLLDPLVANGARPWLAFSVVALGLALAIRTWRWIGPAAKDRAVRWSWTIAVALLGLPAWVLCRVLEPSRRLIAARMPVSGERGTPMVQTLRSANKSKVPALQS